MSPALIGMKPPSRRRSAPARFALGPVVRVWTDRDKRRLLRALRAQGEGPLRPELLKKYLPERDEAEVGGALVSQAVSFSHSGSLSAVPRSY